MLFTSDIIIFLFINNLIKCIRRHKYESKILEPFWQFLFRMIFFVTLIIVFSFTFFRSIGGIHSFIQIQTQQSLSSARSWSSFFWFFRLLCFFRVNIWWCWRCNRREEVFLWLFRNCWYTYTLSNICRIHWCILTQIGNFILSYLFLLFEILLFQIFLVFWQLNFLHFKWFWRKVTKEWVIYKVNHAFIWINVL